MNVINAAKTSLAGRRAHYKQLDYQERETIALGIETGLSMRAMGSIGRGEVGTGDVDRHVRLRPRGHQT